MTDIIWPIIATGLSLCLYWVLLKSAKEEARDKTSVDAITALVETLQMAINDSVIDGKTASGIVGTWSHLFSKGDKRTACACGNVQLHCDKDRSVQKGITRTTKWCDTAGDDGD